MQELSAKQMRVNSILDMCLDDIACLKGKGATSQDFNAEDIRMVMDAVINEPKLTLELQDHIIESYARMEKMLDEMLNNLSGSDVITSTTLNAQVGAIIREECTKSMISDVLENKDKKHRREKVKAIPIKTAGAASKLTIFGGPEKLINKPPKLFTSPPKRSQQPFGRRVTSTNMHIN